MSTSELDKALLDLTEHLAKRPFARFAFEQLEPQRKRDLIKRVSEARKPDERDQRIEDCLDILEAWWAARQIKRS